MHRKPLALIVDDEPSICWGFEQMLGDEGLEVLSTSTAEDGLQLAEQHQPDLIVLDVRLPGIDGLTALPRFTASSADSVIVVMTAFGDLQTAVQAVRNGAADYLTKPFGIDRARSVCRAVLEQRRARLEAHRADSTGSDPADPSNAPRTTNRLVGHSPAMQEVYRKIAMVADSELSVLITGDTGTGKELIAAAIHDHSPRRDGPYLAVAPVALNPTLVESELFGHVRGSFTGADEDRDGLFALAEGGTVLLDEIGDLSPGIQVKLLRVLEQRQYTPVGDVRPRPCDVRVLAATNMGLRSAIAQGEFREDLFYRLSAVEIHAPPLRDRLEDLDELIRHFLRMAGHPAAELPVSKDLLRELSERRWPGNIRQLRNVVEHAALLSRGGPLTPTHLPAADRGESTASSADAGPLRDAVRDWARRTCGDPLATDLMNHFLAAVEPTLLAEVLEHKQGNRAAAADLLGIHRGTLRDRLRRYGLDS